MKVKKLAVAVFLILVVCGIGVYIYMSEDDAALYETAEVRRGDIADFVEDTGIVFSRSVNTFYSDLSRKVSALNVRIGDKVSAGDVILEYENTVELEIEAANKQVDALTAQYNESVKGADFREIANARLNVETVQSTLEMAEDNLAKMKVLYDNEAVSQSDYEKAEKEVNDLRNNLQGAMNSYDLLSQGVSSNVRKQYESQIDEVLVRIKLLEKSRDDNIIRASFDGVITELNVSQGGMTQAGRAVVEIQDDQSLAVYMMLPQEEAYKVAEGMAVMLETEGLQLDGLTVSHISPKAESQISDLGVEQKRVRVEADINVSEMQFLIGSEVDVAVKLSEKTGVLLVDRDAIYKSEGKEYVDILTDGSKESRLIETGIKDDNYAEVLSGLNEGDIIILK